MPPDKNETELLLLHLQNQIIHPKWKWAIEMTRLSRGHKHSIHRSKPIHFIVKAVKSSIHPLSTPLWSKSPKPISRERTCCKRPSTPTTTHASENENQWKGGSSSLEPKGGTDETKLGGAVCLANYEMGPGPKSIPYRFTEFGK
ncbi:hypothetical protein CDAR_120151 [Caerostris darwini]|uniref:Uncharacterized protein n=1 Tax=Caerostris darwini TaxID=1538125 RepID=A0AAV4UQU7_9ARAC|nr:hypothetical protein CDAR_120151 [Caerostris darwini]